MNNGTFIMESGKIEATSTQAVVGETTDNSKWGYCVVNAVTKDSFANNKEVVCEIRGGTLESDAYGMYIQGAGVPGTGLNASGTETRNDLMLVTIQVMQKSLPVWPLEPMPAAASLRALRWILKVERFMQR